MNPQASTFTFTTAAHRYYLGGGEGLVKAGRP
jgi:hypothetical protein